jgi:hypothetical protein
VKTALRELTRTVQHIYPLEINLINSLLCSNEEENPLLTVMWNSSHLVLKRTYPLKLRKLWKMKWEESGETYQIMTSLLVMSIMESEGRFKLAVLIFPTSQKIKRCEECCVLIDTVWEGLGSHTVRRGEGWGKLLWNKGKHRWVTLLSNFVPGIVLLSMKD